MRRPVLPETTFKESFPAADWPASASLPASWTPSMIAATSRATAHRIDNRTGSAASPNWLTGFSAAKSASSVWRWPCSLCKSSPSSWSSCSFGTANRTDRQGQHWTRSSTIKFSSREDPSTDTSTNKNFFEVEVAFTRVGFLLVYSGERRRKIRIKIIINIKNTQNVQQKRMKGKEKEKESEKKSCTYNCKVCGCDSEKERESMVRRIWYRTDGARKVKERKRDRKIKE